MVKITNMAGFGSISRSAFERARCRPNAEPNLASRFSNSLNLNAERTSGPVRFRLEPIL
jgi:hypothetical protein